MSIRWQLPNLRRMPKPFRVQIPGLYFGYYSLTTATQPAVLLLACYTATDAAAHRVECAVQYRAEEDEDSTSTVHVLRLAVVGRPGTAYYGFESLRSLARHREHGVRTRDLERERAPGTPFLTYAFLSNPGSDSHRGPTEPIAPPRAPLRTQVL
jgi:hypothetical protein